MIEYLYEEGSAAGSSGTVSQRVVLPTLFFFYCFFLGFCFCRVRISSASARVRNLYSFGGFSKSFSRALNSMGRT